MGVTKLLSLRGGMAAVAGAVALLAGCATTGSYDGLATRYGNALADAGALGEITPQLRSEHLAVAQASADAAVRDGVAPGDRAALYALAVKSAWIGDAQRLSSQTIAWAEQADMLCPGIDTAEARRASSDCGVLITAKVLGAGEAYTAQLSDIARTAEARWSQDQLDQGAGLAERFATEAAGAWSIIDTHLNRHGDAYPPGFADWARDTQLVQWCQFRSVAGVEALKGIAEGNRPAFLARDRMREAYLTARAEAEPVLPAPLMGQTRMQPLKDLPGDERHAQTLCTLVRG